MDHRSLTFRDEVIDGLRRDLTQGEHGLRGVPSAIKLVIRDEMWRKRVVRETGEIVSFARFSDFVRALPPKGLGADIPLITHICKGAGDIEAVDLIDQATTNPSHRPISVDIINTSEGQEERPTGTSADAAIRRLRKDRPDLHNEVIRGRKSPHAAMVEAGFRPKTATVRLDDPDRVSAFLAKHFDANEIDAIASLAKHIREGQGG